MVSKAGCHDLCLEYLCCDSPAQISSVDPATPELPFGNKQNSGKILEILSVIAACLIPREAVWVRNFISSSVRTEQSISMGRRKQTWPLSSSSSAHIPGIRCPILRCVDSQRKWPGFSSMISAAFTACLVQMRSLPSLVTIFTAPLEVSEGAHSAALPIMFMGWGGVGKKKKKKRGRGLLRWDASLYRVIRLMNLMINYILETYFLIIRFKLFITTLYILVISSY